MMAGFERYYQIARCFRDEDLRADRQPEFTQLDLEMSFVEEDDVIGVMEGLMARVFEETGFPVAAAAVAADDLRRGGAALRLGPARTCASGWRSPTSPRPCAGRSSACFSGGVVRGLNAGALEVARKGLDELTEHAKRFGAGGPDLGGRRRGRRRGSARPPSRWRSRSARAISRELGASPGDLLLMVAGDERMVATVLGELRLELARRYDLAASDRHEILWVVDFPMFELDADGQLDRAAPPVHRADAATCPTRAR